jgi:hypothetical protein
MTYQPIEYIDHIAYLLRIRAEGYRLAGYADRAMGDDGLAKSMEDSAAWFRAQDPELPPRQKREDPSMLYYKGRD